jgi:hypothetical protein
MTMPLAVFQMTEADLTAAVLELLDALGWRACHHRPARTSSGWRTPVQGPTATGWPDVVAVRGERIIAVELKVRCNRPTPAQVAWLEALGAAGVEAYVWTDTDWTDGTIEPLLRATTSQHPTTNHEGAA